MRKIQCRCTSGEDSHCVMGPLPTSTVGNKYLLVIGDYFTKFVHAVPMRNQEADKVAKKLIENFIYNIWHPDANTY